MKSSSISAHLWKVPLPSHEPLPPSRRHPCLHTTRCRHPAGRIAQRDRWEQQLLRQAAHREEALRRQEEARRKRLDAEAAQARRHVQLPVIYPLILPPPLFFLLRVSISTLCRHLFKHAWILSDRSPRKPGHQWGCHGLALQSRVCALIGLLSHTALHSLLHQTSGGRGATVQAQAEVAGVRATLLLADTRRAARAGVRAGHAA